MRSKAIFLTIFPVLPICFFTMDVKLSQQQQFSCHILEDYHLSGSQRQQAAASLIISVLVSCIASPCCIQAEFLTEEGTNTSRPALLQTILENLEKRRKIPRT